MSNIKFQSPDLSHTREIISLVSSTPRLDQNSEYLYALWCSHFSKHSIIAIRDREVIGFLTGFRSPRYPETYFLWQTATKPRHGVSGLGVDMIEHAVRREIKTGATKIEASVDNENKAIRIAVPSGHPLVDKEAIDASSIHPGELLLLSDGHCLRGQIQEACKIDTRSNDSAKSNTGRGPRTQRTSLSTILTLVRAKMGVTLAPAMSLSDGWTTDAGVAIRPESSGTAYRTVRLVYRKTYHRRPLIEKLADLIAATLPNTVSPVRR